jgi:hypothetical protein
MSISERVNPQYVITLENPQPKSSLKAFANWVREDGAYFLIDAIKKGAELCGANADSHWMKGLGNYCHAYTIVRTGAALDEFVDDVNQIKKEPMSANLVCRLAYGACETVAMAAFALSFFVKDAALGVASAFNWASDAVDIGVHGTALSTAWALSSKAEKMGLAPEIQNSLVVKIRYEALRVFKAVAATFGDFFSRPIRVTVAAFGALCNTVAYFQKNHWQAAQFPKITYRLQLATV